MILDTGEKRSETKSFHMSLKLIEQIVDGIPNKDFNGKQTSLTFEIKDVTDGQTLFETHPNKMSEDRAKQFQPPLSDFKVLIERLPFVFKMLSKLDELMKTLIFYKYPYLSNFWCALFVIFILTFDAAYFLSYILALLTCIMGL